MPAMLGVLALGWHSYKYGERKMHVAVPLLVGALPIALTPAITTRLGPAAGYVMLVLAILPLCAVSGAPPPSSLFFPPFFGLLAISPSL